MKELLGELLNHRTLSTAQARSVLLAIASGQVNQSQMAAFLTIYMMRSITVEELAGFRDAMLDLCERVALDGLPAMDVCGTGGDGKDTFNISTLAAFVVAGAGQPVVKHGNTGVSSLCGSSNVMEWLGYRFTADRDTLRRQLDAANICFLHAPLFHPAMRHVGPVRRELGIKTFFNMLGPMVNPADPPFQLVGVFSLDLLRKYAYLYQQRGHPFVIVHALDGYDEISLTGAFKFVSAREERVLTPAALGLPQVQPADLYGGDTVAHAGQLFRRVLGGEGSSAQRSVVIANAALALYSTDPAAGLETALARARESLDSGAARRTLEKLLATQ